jgi:hypothetical protein
MAQHQELVVPFDTNFLELMNANVTWYPFTGEDGNGNPSYGNAVTGIPSLYVGSTTRGTTAFSPQGILGPTPEVTYRVYVPPNVPPVPQFRPRDKIVLDNGVTTFARVVNVYQDPVNGDPGFVVIETEEYR